MNIYIRPAIPQDINDWIDLSHEYDTYVESISGNLNEWYNGNENDISFTSYINAKISQNEAFIATDNVKCLGIIAFSKKNNKITFFAISHNANFEQTGKLLVDRVMTILDTTMAISINILKSGSEIIENQKRMFFRYGFSHFINSNENGVTVETWQSNSNKP